MRSVADDLRDEQLRDALKMTPEDRMRLASRLGEEGLQFFMAANGLTREEALAEVRRQRSAGRTPSRCMGDA
jgi:hypothetical protein